MDVGSMMNVLKTQDASRRVAEGIGASRGHGMQTSATSTTGTGRQAAALGGASTRASSSATGAATGTTGTPAGTSSSTSGSDITSDDFLTLLVAEMKNQDPTQPTDPNAYIQQLVGVNSLQQLIAINGELGGGTGTAGSSGSGSDPITPPVVTGGTQGGS